MENGSRFGKARSAQIEAMSTQQGHTRAAGVGRIGDLVVELAEKSQVPLASTGGLGPAKTKGSQHDPDADKNQDQWPEAEELADLEAGKEQKTGNGGDANPKNRGGRSSGSESIDGGDQEKQRCQLEQGHLEGQQVEVRRRKQGASKHQEEPDEHHGGTSRRRAGSGGRVGVGHGTSLPESHQKPAAS